MSFNTLSFGLFFPVTAGLYLLLPEKLKNPWLLLANYVFYLLWDIRYGAVLLFVTLVAYGAGRLMERYGRRRGILLAALTAGLLPLLVFKYAGFVLQNLNFFASRLSGAHFPALKLLLPVGISFYSFQAAGYVIDVYRGKTEAERNFVVFALFLSFFPLVLSGPIERAERLIPQFREKHVFDAERIRDGCLLMLWGYFLKMVLSERLAVISDTVFGNYMKYSGFSILFAIAVFSLQIYADFESYSVLAAGTAEVMGFSIVRNFRQPYLAESTADFWRRWHMSLTGWFRDYLYIPLGGSRKGSFRKHLNTMIVFAVSGLWHGASWNFVVWGVLNGFFQTAGNILRPLRDRAGRAFGLKQESFSGRWLRRAVTFCLVALAWTFFKAESFLTAVKMLRRALVFNPWVLTDGSLFKLGLKALEFRIMCLSLAVLFAADILTEKGYRLREAVTRQPLWARWIFYILSVLTVLIFGRYGPGYDASQFIYFQF